jgi:hypothetical protein
MREEMRNFTIATGFAFAITAMFALTAAKAEEQIKEGGQCWVNTSNGNYGWVPCPKETHHHHKG